MVSSLTALIELLDLEELEVNIFRGRSPKEDRQRVFGGQVAGQALVAASGELGIAVEDDDAFVGRMGPAPSRDLQGEPRPGVLQPSLEAGPQLGNPMDDVVAVDEEELGCAHRSSQCPPNTTKPRFRSSSARRASISFAVA